MGSISLRLSGVQLSSVTPEKKPVFDLGQKQVSSYFVAIIFPETVKPEDYIRFRCPFTVYNLHIPDFSMMP